MVLKTEGVTTCICFALYGRKQDGTSFIGMYHWSGFNSLDGDDEDKIAGVICKIAVSAREQLGLQEDEALYLDRVFFIGGEKRQEAPDGSLIITGTEREVKALEKFILGAWEAEFDFSGKGVEYIYYNFLTEGEESLTVKMESGRPQPHWFLSTPEIGMNLSSDERDSRVFRF